MANALEDCPNVPGKVRSIIGCNSDIDYVMSTLVSRGNWVQLLAHETRKRRRRSAKTLCKSFVRIVSASKIECKHFHRTYFCDFSLSFLRHLIQVVFLRSGNIQILLQIAPRMFLTVFLIQSCQFSFVFKSCNFFGKSVFFDK